MPVAAPFPHVAFDVEQAERIGTVRSDRRGEDIPVRRPWSGSGGENAFERDRRDRCRARTYRCLAADLVRRRAARAANSRFRFRRQAVAAALLLVKPLQKAIASFQETMTTGCESAWSNPGFRQFAFCPARFAMCIETGRAVSALFGFGLVTGLAHEGREVSASRFVRAEIEGTPKGDQVLRFFPLLCGVVRVGDPSGIHRGGS